MCTPHYKSPPQIYLAYLHERIQRDCRLCVIPQAAGAVGNGLPVSLQRPLEVLVVIIDLKILCS